ncbi:MAG: DNA polymerase [Candidatus Methylacidiphilales bacterium]
MSLRQMLIDFNSYFASVEQHLDPSLRGQPVGVVPMMADTTCCIAASYEAKAFGVKTGTRVADARTLCPGIHFIEARHRTYVEWHHQLLDIIESCIHIDQVLSIDEVSCTLPRNWRNEEKVREVGRRIKQRIREQTSEAIRCSIGVGPNVFLAKMASNMQKPDGFTFIHKDKLPEVLYGLDLSDLHGVGKNMLLRLHAYGIRTVEDLCGARKEHLRQVWGGIEGERMFDKLRGEEMIEVPTQRSTFGHSHVLAPDEREPQQARAVLHRLTQKAAVRLRHAGFFCGRIQISLKYLTGGKSHDELRILETQDTLELIRCLNRLWNRRVRQTARLLAVGVTLTDLLAPENRTPRLLDDDGGRREALNQAVDALNRRFGPQKVYFGGAHEARQSAPMRIAFHHIPDLVTEADDAG